MDLSAKHLDNTLAGLCRYTPLERHVRQVAGPSCKVKKGRHVQVAAAKPGGLHRYSFFDNYTPRFWKLVLKSTFLFKPCFHREGQAHHLLPGRSAASGTSVLAAVGKPRHVAGGAAFPMAPCSRAANVYIYLYVYIYIYTYGK